MQSWCTDVSIALRGHLAGGIGLEASPGNRSVWQKEETEMSTKTVSELVQDLLRTSEESLALCRQLRQEQREILAQRDALLEACVTAEANLTPKYSSDHLVMKRLRAAIYSVTLA